MKKQLFLNKVYVYLCVSGYKSYICQNESVFLTFT